MAIADEVQRIGAPVRRWARTQKREYTQGEARPLGADLGAMGDALSLLAGGPRLLYVVLFAALCVGMQVFLRYTRYVAILKWTTLSLLAYFAAAALAGVVGPPYP